MLELIKTVVSKYLVELIVGGLATALIAWFKHYMALEKKEREKARDTHYGNLLEEIKKNNQELSDKFASKYADALALLDQRCNDIDDKLRKAMQEDRVELQQEDEQLHDQVGEIDNSLNVLKSGILSIQGKMFKDTCREYLMKDHVITLQEWEELNHNHYVYNSLGGNHDGDSLFALVKKKVENDLTDEGEQ